MTGTEKQIKWAEQIKASYTKSIKDVVAVIKMRQETYGDFATRGGVEYVAKVEALAAKVLEAAEGYTSASMWIDQRNRFPMLVTQFSQAAAKL